MDVKKEETKCVAVHIPKDLIAEIDQLKEKLGLSKNALLVELIKLGLEEKKKE
ncbi:MAG: ribbon-helix-helix protein, CopG family [bacterium]